jgi:hypothetical protein
MSAEEAFMRGFEQRTPRCTRTCVRSLFKKGKGRSRSACGGRAGTANEEVGLQTRSQARRHTQTHTNGG